MKRYDSYKDSGVEWIGEIPSSWEICRLKYLCSVSTGNRDTQDKVEDGKYPFFVRSPIVERINSFSYEGESVLTVGDGVGTGKVFHYYNGKFEFHQRVYKFSDFDKVLGKYFFEFMKNKFINVTEDQNSKSTVDSLRRPLIDNFIFCFPSLFEQLQIVEYLDTQTSMIDSLIEKTQRKIELLKEKKTTLINEVVTKGLNPNVEMKDSGVEWIGEIPKHWDLYRIRNIFKILKRISGELGYDVLSVTQRGIKVKDLDNLEGQHSMDYSKYQLVYDGDFVMNHMDLLTGYVDLSKHTGVTSPDYRVFRKSKDDVDNRYYLYIFQICYTLRIFYGYGQGVSNLGRWRLPSDEFLNFHIPFPPYKEQSLIVEYLDKERFLTDKTISIEERRIEHLKEYRQSLISEVVTGKVKVTTDEHT